MTTATLALPTIDLAELIARGSLLTRVDRKYALASADAAMALDLVDAATTRVLEIDGRTDLGYTSVYLDTPGLDSYLRAARDRRRRYKVRARRYESNGASFLEVKTPFRGHTVKTRLAGDHLHDGRLDAQGVAFVTDTLRGAGIHDVEVDALTASLRVDYQRVTLFHEPSQARVTIDSDLAWRDLRTGCALTRPELAIIETKSTGRPASMDRLLWSLGHRPDRISKYATALGAIHPHLTSNKWRPVLKEHF